MDLDYQDVRSFELHCVAAYYEDGCTSRRRDIANSVASNLLRILKGM
jgi:hypothetical protein